VNLKSSYPGRERFSANTQKMTMEKLLLVFDNHLAFAAAFTALAKAMTKTLACKQKFLKEMIPQRI
jgi:hypothetical protein